MKKTLSLMGVLLLIVIVACKRDYLTGTEKPRNQEAFLEEARHYYNKVRGTVTKKAAANGTLSANRGIPQLTPYWDKARVVAGRNTSAELPVSAKRKRVTMFSFAHTAKPTRAQNQLRFRAAFQRTLIYKKPNGKVRGLLLTYIPDYQYLQTHSKRQTYANRITKLAPDFTGYISYASLKTGKNFQVLYVDKGRVVKKLYAKSYLAKRKKAAPAKKARQAVRIMSGDGCEEEPPVYEGDCEGEGGEEESCEEDCDGDGGEWGGGGEGEGCEGEEGGGEEDCYEEEEPGEEEDCDEEEFWMCEDDPDCYDPEFGECGDDEPKNAADSLNRIMKSNCLTEPQKQVLYDVFSEYSSGQGNDVWQCIFRAVYDKVVAADKKVGFCIDGNAGAAGRYYPATEEIKWPDEAAMSNSTTFSHEFFHVHQDEFYDGIEKYAKGTGKGNPNIEFEPVLLQDFLNGSKNATALSAAPDSISIPYGFWLHTVTNGDTKFPTKFSDFGETNGVNNYYIYLNHYYQYANFGELPVGKGIVDDNMPPNALLDLFSSTNCK